MKHQVQAADGGAAESRIAVTAFTSGAAALHQLLVELLQDVGGQLGELDAADAGDGILLDHQVVAIRRGHPHIGLGIDVVPAPQPCGNGVLVGAADVDTLGGFHSGSHETASGAIYFDTSKALPGITGVGFKDHNRTDDPLGKDAVKLCRSTNESLLPDDNGAGTPGNTPATGDTGVLVWVIALPVTALAAAFVLKRKEREA